MPANVRIERFKASVEELVLEHVQQTLDEYTPSKGLQMKPLLLPERGQKHRIATISPASAVVSGQKINGLLMRLLKRSSVFNFSLSGSRGTPRNIKEGVRRYASNPKFIGTSADLSAASDWIPHDLGKAVWAGICNAAGPRIPEEFRRMGEALLGPMSNILDPGAGPTTRGILMGLPLTWPVLSLINDFAAHEAQVEDGLSGYNYVICGDDLAATWTEGAQAAYYRLMGELGLKINHHKSYESTSGVVFTEELYIIDLRRSQLTARVQANELAQENTIWSYIKLAMRPHSVPSRRYGRVGRLVRPLLSAVITAKRRGSNMPEHTPLYLALPDILTYEYGRTNKSWRKKRIMDIANEVHRVEITKMRKVLPLCWPKELGGWGMPGKQSAPVEYRKFAAIVLSGRDEYRKRLINLHATSRAPKFLRKKAHEDVDLFSQHPRKNQNEGTTNRRRNERGKAERP